MGIRSLKGIPSFTIHKHLNYFIHLGVTWFQY
jgi:hypothetical protein